MYQNLMWLKPLHILIEHWIPKAILALLASLFTADPAYVGCVLITVVLHAVMGLRVAWRERREGAKRPCSRALLETGKLVLEYGVLLAIVQSMANAFEFVAWVDSVVWFYVAFTMGTEVMEKTAPGSKARLVWKKVKQLIENRVDPHELGK